MGPPDGYHTNTIESAFSLLKHGLIGSFHPGLDKAPAPLFSWVWDAFQWTQI